MMFVLRWLLICVLLFTSLAVFAVSAVKVTPPASLEYLPPDEYPNSYPGRFMLSERMRVSAPGKTFPKGITLTLTFVDSHYQPYGIDNVRIFKYVPSQKNWMPITSTIDKTHCLISASIGSAGLYVVSAVSVPDNICPTIAWVPAKTDGPLTSILTAEVLATDNVGIASVTYYLNGIELLKEEYWRDGWVLEHDVSRIASGTYILTAKAADLAENEAEVSRQVEIRSDAVAPVLTLRSIMPGMAADPMTGYIDPVVCLDGSVFDADRKPEEFVESDERPFTISLLFDGKEIAEFEIVDGDYGPTLGRAFLLDDDDTHWRVLLAGKLFPVGTTHSITVTVVDRDNNATSITREYRPPLFGVRLDKRGKVDVDEEQSYEEQPYAKLQTPYPLEAKSMGGTLPEYRFFASHDGEHWEAISDYSATTTCTWTPTVSGKYTLKVTARERGDAEEYAGYYQCFVPAPLSGVKLSTKPEASGLTDSSIEITASATGGEGENVSYVFEINNVIRWTLQGEGNPNEASVTWEPNVPGMFTLKVTARAEGNPKAFTAAIPFRVVQTPPLTGVTLSANLPSPQPVNSTVVFTPTAKGGGYVEYDYLASTDNGKQWTKLNEFSFQNRLEWNTDKVGSYLLKVVAREYGTKKMVSAQMAYTFTKEKPLTGVTLTTSPSSPQPLKQDGCMFIYAQATNGLAVSYVFSVFDGAEWTTLQNNEPSDYDCSWTPAKPGTYILKVVASEDGGKQEFSAQQTFVVAPPLPLSAVMLMECSPPSPQLVGTSVTLKGAPSDGDKVQYRFQVNLGQAWTTINDFSPAETCVWTPATTGFYQVRVVAREGEAGPEVVSDPVDYTIGSPQPLTGIALMTIPYAKQSPAGTVTLTACPDGGSTGVQYAFSVRDGDTWVPIRDFAGSDTATWQPAHPGTFLLQVQGRDPGMEQPITSRFVPFTITEPLTGVSLKADRPTCPTNNYVTLTAVPKGGANLRYMFFVFQQDEWQYWNNETLDPSFTYQSETPQTLRFKVEVIEEDGKSIVETELSYTFTPPLPLSGVSLVSEPSNTSIIYSDIYTRAEIVDGINVEYEFAVRSGAGAWHVLSPFSEDAELSWYNEEPGTYHLRVLAREKGSDKVFSDEMTFEVK